MSTNRADTITLSVVIPAYQEGGHIYDSVVAVLAHVSRLTPDHELILVDDGSTDSTWSEIASVSETVIVPLRLPEPLLPPPPQAGRKRLAQSANEVRIQVERGGFIGTLLELSLTSASALPPGGAAARSAGPEIGQDARQFPFPGRKSVGFPPRALEGFGRGGSRAE